MAEYGALSYQDTMNLMRGRTPEYATNPAITYTRCCMLGFIHYQFFSHLLQSKISSTEALLFPKKLVFRVGKKAFADRQALLQFLVVPWLVRIANVLGCVG
ncbi:MAG: hypothetical protein HGB12_08720 [Bacteroidetes bacterium]|nr:hypothetical protein [Bacteroidota bacterium]